MWRKPWQIDIMIGKRREDNVRGEFSAPLLRVAALGRWMAGGFGRMLETIGTRPQITRLVTAAEANSQGPRGLCPDCTGQLVKQVAKCRGEQIIFLGCSNYPHCRYRESIDTPGLSYIAPTWVRRRRERKLKQQLRNIKSHIFIPSYSSVIIFIRSITARALAGHKK